MFELAKIIGKVPLEKYSGTITVSEPITVLALLEMLGMPAELSDETIVIRGGKLLSESDLVTDSDEILLFPVIMGG